MIIDALTHITVDGSWFHTDRDASLISLLSAMEAGKADRAVLAGIPGVDDDDLILEAVETNPGRFIPVAGIDVSLSGSELETRMERVRDLGFAGVKLHPRLSAVSLAESQMKEAVRLAGKMNLAAMVCTIHKSPLSPLGQPISDVIHGLCAACDNTRIILVHGGYTDLLATSEVVRPMEHVLLDLSLTLTRFEKTSLGLDMAWLLETFDRRICVGSDFPEGDMGKVREALFRLGGDESLLRKMGSNLLAMLDK